MPEKDEGRWCSHQRGHITDSVFFGHGYATEASRSIFCDLCRVQRWLDVEAALALVQEELGIIPEGVGQRIAATARAEKLDLTAVARSVRESGHSLVGLLAALARACPGDSGQYVHFGATTQDIQDTAQVLEMRAVLGELDALLRRCVRALLDLLAANGNAMLLGRTHARPAMPMTLGVKLAGWIDEILRQAERIAAMRPRVLAVQMYGAVGTMAGFGDKGPVLLDRMATRLDLAAPDAAWHVARDRVAEFVCTLAMTCASVARIADEIRLLSRPEFGEFEEGWMPGAIGSSTMPHKRNPEVCEQIVALARLAAGLVVPALLAMSGDGERDARALRVEWACVPDAAHYCLAACQKTAGVLERLHIDHDRLQANLAAAGDEIFSEKLMLALAGPIGKQRAHALIYELAISARQARIPLRQAFEADPECARLLDAARLDTVFDPADHLGAARHLTAGVVEAACRYMQSPAPKVPGALPGPASGGPQ
jgi:adenylosuccinate lyase